MRLIKGSLVGLVLAGILALAPTAAFAHGGGGGGHGGGGGGFGGGHGGGHFAGGGGHFAGGGGHFAGGGGHFAGGGGHFVGGGGHFAGSGAISPGIVLPAIASQNTKERTLRGTKIISETEIISGTGIISGTTEISFLEMPLRMITHTTGSTIRTTAIMTTMLATIPMGNPHQPK